MEKLKKMIQSRKFWASVVGLLLVVFRTFVEDFPISDEQMMQAILILVSFIIGTGLEDSKPDPVKEPADEE